MKCIKWIVLLLMLFLIIGIPFSVSAMDTGMSTESLSDEEMSDIVKQNKFVKITSYSPLPAKCFDVRDDHMVVIGADAGDTAVIAVYDDRGNFQYGFKKDKLGSFRVMWSGSDIAYYSIRSAFLFKINEDGEIKDICRVANTMENGIYDRDVLLSTIRKIGTSSYRMTNERVIADALPGSFKKIIKTDTEGTTVIYDASNQRRASIVRGMVVFFMLSSIIVSSAVVGIKKHCNIMEQKKQSGNSVDDSLTQ